LLFGGGATTEEGAAVQLDAVHTVYDDGRHNAFTDLQRWRSAWWVTFRNGTDHGSPDGDVLVLRSEDVENWETTVRLDTGLDDRDPKLLATDDTLFCYFANRQDGIFHSQVATTTDGRAWTEPLPIYEERVWLWRPRHAGGRFWCAAYAVPEHRDRSTWYVDLLTSTDGVAWEKQSTVARENCPNECDLWTDQDKMMHVISRREDGPRTALLAEGPPPYGEWQHTDLEVTVQAPVVLPEGAGVWIAGRGIEGGAARTMLWRLADGVVHHALTLPSGGDTSYPGLLRDGERLLMSYYSEHESMSDEGYKAGHGPSRIYLAEIPTAE
jgi:hypothetical protein